MKTYAGSHEDFDRFIVPTVPDSKQERDTVMTIRQLSELGVPASKIIVVFNKIENPDELDTGFQLLRAYHEEHRSFSLRRDAVVYDNPIYANLRAMGSRSIAEIRDDATDYKEKLAQALREGDHELASVMKSLIAMKRLASGVSEQLDRAFEAITRKGRAGE